MFVSIIEWRKIKKPRHFAAAYLDHNHKSGSVIKSDCPCGGHHSQIGALFTSLIRPRGPFLEILACGPVSAGDKYELAKKWLVPSRWIRCLGDQHNAPARPPISEVSQWFPVWGRHFILLVFFYSSHSSYLFISFFISHLHFFVILVSQEFDYKL